MTLSVIIPTYNRANLLPCAIESIIRQSRTPEQIIVIDDGSNDNTKQVCDSYHDLITYLYKANGGKSSALNMALQYVRGNIIYILDDDDIALKHTLHLHESALVSNPHAGFSYGPLLHGYLSSTGSIHIDRQPRLAKYRPNEFFLQQLIASNVVQPCLAFRQRCVEHIGGFDEHFIRSQDYEFSLRLSRHFSGVRIQRPVFIQRQHSGARGSQSNPISTNNLHTMWHLYDSMAIRKTIDSMGLDDFYKGCHCDISDTTQIRAAYIRKGVIEMRCGKLNAFLGSIRRAFKADTQAPVSEDERRLFDQLLSAKLANRALLRSPSTMIRFPFVFRGIRGRAALGIARKRMLWRTVSEIRRGSILDGLIGMIFVGYMGTVKVFAGRTRWF